MKIPAPSVVEEPPHGSYARFDRGKVVKLPIMSAGNTTRSNTDAREPRQDFRIASTQGKRRARRGNLIRSELTILFFASRQILPTMKPT